MTQDRAASATVSQRLGRVVSDLRYADLPDICRRAARIGMTDAIGTLLAGSADPATALIARALDLGAPGNAPSDRDLALAYGFAAHVLDYDDMAMMAHPSAVLMAAIWAHAAANPVSGQAAITAYCAGYEVWAALFEPVADSELHTQGFHPTGVFGTIAAAAAGASLRGLDPGQAANAIGLAASMSAGLVANFGSMSKALHAGRAAQSGLAAARFAAQGVTATADVIEHPTGFYGAFAPRHGPDGPVAIDLSGGFRLERQGTHIKRYPVCYLMHGAIDSAIDLARRADIAPADVARIELRTWPQKLAVLRNHRPQTGLQAKFSYEFSLAAAIIRRKVGLADLTDSVVRDTGLVAMMARVTCLTDHAHADELERTDRVSVVLTDGTVLTATPVPYPRGNWRNPLNDAELSEKFLDCSERVLPPDTASALFTDLTRLDDLHCLPGIPMPLLDGSSDS